MVRVRAELLVILFAVVVSAAVACRDRPPAAPTGAFSGTWTGVVTDSASGSGSVRLSIEERDSSVVGTFATTFGGVVSRDGPAQGARVGSTLVLTFTPAVPLNCGGGVTLSGTLSITLTPTGSRLSGTYAGLVCGGAVTGSLDLVRS